ncbi:putative beta-glucosidase L [Diplonema papillatum]|nr:putative beta-glucosidase L [Diplonema papillatum]
MFAMLTMSVAVLAQTPAERAEALAAQMTVAELISMLHGSSGQYVGNVVAIPRLGIPALNLNDGPQGFRDDAHPGTTTAFPSGLTMAATWDEEMLSLWGTMMGEEFYGKGANVQLGPGLCIARIPQNGRNFEYLSGEDPHLGYTLVQPAIKGIQSQKVVANAKHYVNNNQETDRTTISEMVDERTENEIYYAPFEGAVAAGVGSVMCSYNKINGTWSCENPDTLGRDLKARNGFQGWVMSDWGATHSLSIKDGLDQEMPSSNYFGKTLEAAVANGSISQDTVKASVVRILTPLFALGIMDDNNTNSITANVTSTRHNEGARNMSRHAMVMVQNNENMLPLTATTGMVIAVVGTQAVSPIVAGGGSGHVTGYYASAPLYAIQDKLGIPRSSSVGTKQCNSNNVCTIYANTPASAATAAKGASAALVFVGNTSSEGSDRKSLSLGSDQDELVMTVGQANAKTAVVIVTPGACLTPWRTAVKSIIVAFMPGQEYGNAAAEILFGDHSPSGRLPLTFPLTENDQEFTAQQFPGVNGEAHYSEKLLFGYRYYLANNKAPAFPFGHGLAYGNFVYSNLTINGMTVTFEITAHVGQVPISETPQLYLGFPAEAGEPPLQLKWFRKHTFPQSGSVTFIATLSDRSISVWDTASSSWKQVSGQFRVAVGSSVQNLQLSGTMTVPAKDQ